MKSSYREEDVILLLKDITGMVKPQPTEERERLIQAGRHYCEMLPIEYVPSQKYMEAYQAALQYNSKQTAKAVGILAAKIILQKGKDVVLVSLARAGIPIGILLKRYIEKYYFCKVPHYSISIIRGKGIDNNAVKYLLEHYAAENLLFVDGWVGKGAIKKELEKSVQKYKGVSSELAVVADPANITQLCGTHEDILIPSSCLNCTVSGLISRTFLRDDIIGKNDFHGAVYYGELKEADLSYDFIDKIEKEFLPIVEKIIDDNRGKREEEKIIDNNGGRRKVEKIIDGNGGKREVEKIAEELGIMDINLIKPGIGETTRVLLRRVPWKIFIQDKAAKDASLKHILRLAEEKGVSVEYYPLQHYKACGIIQKMSDT